MFANRHHHDLLGIDIEEARLLLVGDQIESRHFSLEIIFICARGQVLYYF